MLKVALKNISLIFSALFILGCSTAFYNKNIAASELNVRLGLAYLDAGWVKEAKGKLLLALRLNPKGSESHGAYAYFLERVGQTQFAEKYYLQAISLAFDSAKRGAACNNYGTFLYRQKRNREAITYFLKASSEPSYLNTASVYENAALAAKAMKDDKMANLFLRRSLENGANKISSR